VRQQPVSALVIFLAMTCFASVGFAQDENPRMLQSLDMLGYCYQFPEMFKSEQADNNDFNMEGLSAIRQKYIDLVLTAPEESEAYVTRKALESGRKRFMDDVTFLAQDELALRWQECSVFLGKYIKRVFEIENRSLPSSPVY
jgi:hypothetical protein